ncbi:tRNA adenosine(34) deaminase TadA [Desulfatirhabdium butyrativorans]|uniref:tRNA adenosine(34) deaminase TadA n=1 Tax=Desulfatirhabdium butyrativorans TaxID=340467 RepID=UPI0003F66D2C|nr:tRNA adenosine(34) deaminase TadA [Desulfatirhabdium butyrativorans]
MQEFMQIAIEQARQAFTLGEVPIGAVLVDAEGQILAKDCNRTISSCDPTAHAEILVIRKASAILGNYRLLNTTLYVSIEPCVMCMGALIHARVHTVVYGASDPRWGACDSLYAFARDTRFNHRPETIGGICEEPCRKLMQDFFRQRRQAHGMAN